MLFWSFASLSVCDEGKALGPEGEEDVESMNEFIKPERIRIVF